MQGHSLDMYSGIPSFTLPAPCFWIILVFVKIVKKTNNILLSLWTQIWACGSFVFFWLRYNWLIMLCWFLLCGKVIQLYACFLWFSPLAQRQELPAVQEMHETWVQSLSGEDPLEKKMATNSSILAWKNPMDKGAWWAAVHGVAKSWVQLKRLSMHTRICSLVGM